MMGRTFEVLKNWFVEKGGYVANGIERRETEFGAGLCASNCHTQGFFFIFDYKCVIEVFSIIFIFDFIS